MLIDCSTCVARDVACGDCVVTVLLGGPPDRARAPLDLDDAERVALGSLARAGLVPPLRLVRGLAQRPAPQRGIA